MNTHSKRTGYLYVIEDGEASITIFKARSGEFSQFGKYIVLYESAFGEINLSTLTIGQIAAKYTIDIKVLEDVI